MTEHTETVENIEPFADCEEPAESILRWYTGPSRIIRTRSHSDWDEETFYHLAPGVYSSRFDGTRRLLTRDIWCSRANNPGDSPNEPTVFEYASEEAAMAATAQCPCYRGDYRFCVGCSGREPNCWGCYDGEDAKCHGALLDGCPCDDGEPERCTLPKVGLDLVGCVYECPCHVAWRAAPAVPECGQSPCVCEDGGDCDF